MTIRKLLALLQPYSVGAEDDAECEVTIDADAGCLVVDMGSDVHRLCLEHQQCEGRHNYAGCTYEDAAPSDGTCAHRWVRFSSCTVNGDKEGCAKCGTSRIAP